ncbi:hypothetical protein DUI87_18642 [Hirundo rustica rustica]|uniref:Uncharacterized protein n=1 Tax=Hirundo rustica rustica TaxID=333673 RepID=A0A3M0JX43_HIRRU|nr:hypothetical protein DUI87_18642 [Hirundo rustica rustica]
MSCAQAGIVQFTSLQCCPAGLAQLQVRFGSLDQPLAALLNAESQGRDGDTSSNQICAALVDYLLETGDPHKSQATLVLHLVCTIAFQSSPGLAPLLLDGGLEGISAVPLVPWSRLGVSTSRTEMSDAEKTSETLLFQRPAASEVLSRYSSDANSAHLPKCEP